MYIIQLILFIINIQIIYSYGLNNRLVYTYENLTDYLVLADEYSLNKYISVYNKYQTLNKNKVLKIKNNINLSYYCKNNICVRVDRHNLPEFVEIPDEKGNIKRYISKSYNYNDLKLSKSVYINFNKCIYDIGQLNNQKNYKCYSGAYISFKCTSDSQCLTNKCIDGVCIFNEENPIEFCTDIYRYSLIFGGYSYMYCGKTIHDTCNNNKECGSKNCLKNNTCGKPREPSENDGLREIIIFMYISFIIFIILCFCCCIILLIKQKIRINIFYLFIFFYFIYIIIYVFIFLIINFN